MVGVVRVTEGDVDADVGMCGGGRNGKRRGTDGLVCASVGESTIRRGGGCLVERLVFDIWTLSSSSKSSKVGVMLSVIGGGGDGGGNCWMGGCLGMGGKPGGGL